MTYEMLQRAAAEIAARCDGAVDEDGVGFNGTDSRFGKAFAAMPAQAIDDTLARAAWEMLRKYRGQLERYGVPFEDIPEPQAGGTSKDYRYVDVLDGRLAFRFPYNPGLISDVKRSVPGARFNGQVKCWTAPASPQAIEAAETLGFAVVPDAVALAADAPPPPPLGRVSVDGDLLAIAFDYDPAAVEAVRDIPGRKFDGGLKRWMAPLASRDQVLAFAERFRLAVDPGVAAITAEEMAESVRPTVTVSRGMFEIRFPFDRDLVARVKEIGGATWMGGYWGLPLAAAAPVADWIERTNARVDETVTAVLVGIEEERAVIAASKATDADITVPGLRRDLLPFQRAGVAYTLARLGFAS